jgi:hypothetical protein
MPTVPPEHVRVFRTYFVNSTQGFPQRSNINQVIFSLINPFNPFELALWLYRGESVLGYVAAVCGNEFGLVDSLYLL